MAQRVEVVLVDDIDGGTADETVSFALDGVSYEIDLSDANAAALRRAMGEWIERGRRVGGRKASAKAAVPRSRRSRGANDDIRQWARDNGFDVKERGRVPVEVLEAYEAAH